MGWDAYSSAETITVDNTMILADEDLRKQFADACKRVVANAGCVDGWLDIAGVNCSGAGRMLEKATGKSVYVTQWTVIQVFAVNDIANWNFEYDKDEACNYWSARELLTLCAKNQLAINFSW